MDGDYSGRKDTETPAISMQLQAKASRYIYIAISLQLASIDTCTEGIKQHLYLHA